MPGNASTRFCLIRHGETDWNGEKRIQGQIDIDLNARGRAQAHAVATGLAGQGFDALYSSDLKRAWHTARIAATDLGTAVSPAPTLRERHFGVLQGVTPAEALEHLPDAHHHHKRRTPDYAFDTGESLIDFAARVMEGLELMARRHRGGSVLAFTHGGVLDVVHRAATGKPLEAPRDFDLPNAALNWVEHDGAGWRLIRWADRRHLERALDEVTG